MLNYNELKPGKCIVLEGQPYQVVEAKFLRMQQRKPVMQTKIKNIINGKTIERNFQQGEKFEEAEIETKEIKYLYNHRGEYWFCEPDNPGKRFQLKEENISEKADLLKPNSIIEAVLFNNKIIGIKLPIKIDYKVVEAPPGVKGNTAQGGTKQVVIETGAKINTPLFINEGDIIRINTETREYVERVEKAD